ncbi:MAG: hypothetical protein K5Q00_04905 [Gammaproteobacteria bacterium]|nr:hypothetical protein [Gammaproteobacteria bacterium]
MKKITLAILLLVTSLVTTSAFAWNLTITNSRPAGQYSSAEQRVLVKVYNLPDTTINVGQTITINIPDDVTQAAIYAYGAYNEQPIPAGIALRNKNGSLFVGENVNDAQAGITTTATLTTSVNGVNLPVIASGQSFDDFQAGQSQNPNQVSMTITD